MSSAILSEEPLSGWLAIVSMGKNMFSHLLEVSELLVEAGYDKSLDYSSKMKAKGYEGSAMASGGYEPYALFAIYLTQEVGNWAIGKFCDLLLIALKRAFVDKDYSGRVQVTVEYANELKIVVDSPAKSVGDAERLVKSILKTHKQVTVDEELRRMTGKTLTYSIKEEETLPNKPEVTD